MNEINTKKYYEMLKKDFNQTVSIILVENVYTEIRKIFKNYLSIIYQSEILGERKNNKYFSVDESLFCSDGNQNEIQILGVINNITKQYRLDISYQRKASILKTSITKYVERGNTKVCNG